MEEWEKVEHILNNHKHVDDECKKELMAGILVLLAAVLTHCQVELQKKQTKVDSKLALRMPEYELV